MNRRSRIIIDLAVSAMALTAASDIHASAATPPPSSPDTEVSDTLISETTRSVIETLGELTRTASKLSETALKLLQAQDEIDRRREQKGQTENVNAPRQSISQTNVTIPVNDEKSATDKISEKEPTPEGKKEEGNTEPRVFLEDDKPKIITSDNDVPAAGPVWNMKPENTGKGQYIWVPEGQELSTSLQKSTEPNLNELVYWRGDSIPIALPTKRYGRFDRKLYNWLIYPKGQWHISLSANYGELTTEDSEILSLLKDIDVGGKIYSIKPSVSYFFKNNLCAGIRLAFTKGELAIDNFKVDIDEDINFNLHDVKYSSDSYAAAVYLQQHFGMSRKSRFSVYNEVELAYGMGSKHFIRPFDGEMKDTRTKTQSFNINYSPGVSIMMMKYAAFNLSFGIFGFHLQDEKQWENGEESGSRFTSGINFRFNIFNINFGVSIII